MKSSFICPRCGNADPRYIGFRRGAPYCRRCIGFAGEEVTPTPGKMQNVKLTLRYPLSREQKQLSEQIIANFKNGIDTLVYAVCGSGKTEISYGVIAYAMSLGLKVGFALPRRDVVIELFYRLKEAFPEQKIVAVYGGHAGVLAGDCVILTTHQLYRYPRYFDLLIMDEIDAFPFKGSDLLLAMFRRALKGHSLLLSATPSKELVKEYRKEGHMVLTLHTRFHRHPIPVPTCVCLSGKLQGLWAIAKLKKYRKEGKPVFVFVPSVAISESLYRLISLVIPGGDYVSSQREGRERIIRDFKKGKYAYLITTAVLERGVTIKDLQVIVFHADNEIYDAAALIQIAGRVGRKANAPKGEVTFLGERKSLAMARAIREIDYCNTFLQGLLRQG